MGILKRTKELCPLVVFIALLALLTPSVSAGSAIGPQVGYDFDSDNLVLGGEAELGRAFQNFRFAPGIDVEPGDNSITTLNADFRLHLFNLPETGLQFYGAAGPTVIFNSSGRGGSETEVGLSLVGGMKIPMSGKNCYNVQLRFGIGDIPDLKIMFGVLFGL